MGLGDGRFADRAVRPRRQECIQIIFFRQLPGLFSDLQTTLVTNTLLDLGMQHVLSTSHPLLLRLEELETSSDETYFREIEFKVTSTQLCFESQLHFLLQKPESAFLNIANERNTKTNLARFVSPFRLLSGPNGQTFVLHFEQAQSKIKKSDLPSS